MYWYLVYDIIDHKLVMHEYENNYSSLITIKISNIYIYYKQLMYYMIYDI